KLEGLVDVQGSPVVSEQVGSQRQGKLRRSAAAVRPLVAGGTVVAEIPARGQRPVRATVGAHGHDAAVAGPRAVVGLHGLPSNSARAAAEISEPVPGGGRSRMGSGDSTARAAARSGASGGEPLGRSSPSSSCPSRMVRAANCWGLDRSRSMRTPVKALYNDQA